MSATSNADKLVRMANQIATFFRSYPEEEAVAGIHKHIVAFWTPKMRATLESHAASAGDALDALVRRALDGAPQAESVRCGPRPATRSSSAPAPATPARALGQRTGPRISGARRARNRASPDFQPVAPPIPACIRESCEICR